MLDEAQALLRQLPPLRLEAAPVRDPQRVAARAGSVRADEPRHDRSRQTPRCCASGVRSSTAPPTSPRSCPTPPPTERARQLRGGRSPCMRESCRTSILPGFPCEPHYGEERDRRSVVTNPALPRHASRTARGGPSAVRAPTRFDSRPGTLKDRLRPHVTTGCGCERSSRSHSCAHLDTRPKSERYDRP